jgi:hypothetical protein
MRIPNADKAVIAPTKLRDYLLNPSHRRGSAKARVLIACGYRAEAWEVLEADLRSLHLTAEVAAIAENSFGMRYTIRAAMITPNGRQNVFRSLWQIDTGASVPRLITLYPG